MAKGKKTGGRDFKPGESGNPKGRPPITETEKFIKKTISKEVYDYINQLFYMDTPQVMKLLEDKSTPHGMKIFVRFFVDAAKTGNLDHLEFLFKAIGKNINKVEIDNISSDGSVSKNITVEFVKPSNG